MRPLGGACRAGFDVKCLPTANGLPTPDPYSDPFVDGIAPAARGSRATAIRSARPNALNTVSHW